VALFPFEATERELAEQTEVYVKAVCKLLESEFLVLPRGDGFIDYATFDKGYEALKRTTRGFVTFDCERISDVAIDVPISLVVLRSMLGFTPPEWAYVTTQSTGEEIQQGFARTLDREVRLSPLRRMNVSEQRAKRIRSMVEAACSLLSKECPGVKADKIHRLDKADTKEGPQTIQSLANVGVPYSMLLYERFLGRPFAGHRDSVSELVGDSLETKIEEALVAAGISCVKTKRAQRVPGFDQAPDFMVPNQLAPQVVIEAKITEDDGTARDKVTRVQHLHALSMRGVGRGRPPKFEVVACIGGRGFGVRREDMKKLLLATRGKTFTMKQLDKIVDHTKLSAFRTKSDPPPVPPVLPPDASAASSSRRPRKEAK
jgi:hypothetical protein